MIQNELEEVDLMYSTVLGDTRWYKGRTFYTQKVVSSSPTSPISLDCAFALMGEIYAKRFSANIFANELFST
jgi:hypothetical protein